MRKNLRLRWRTDKRHTKSKEHYEENFIPAGWNLDYTCLDQPEAARALYLTGVCLHCGGQLGKSLISQASLPGMPFGADLPPDGVLPSV